MTDDSFYVCPTCRRPVDPDEPGTKKAFQQIRTDSLASTNPEFIDGTGHYVHDSCRTPSNLRQA